MFLAALIVLAPTTVVMVHGAGGGGWEYDLWKPVFERAGYRVVARDLMPAADGLSKTRFEDYVRQVQMWRPVGGKVVLVGASMGGILALRSANLERPEALVLVNSVVPMPVAVGRKGLKPSPPIVKWANGPLKDTEVAMPDSDRKTIFWAWKRWRDESGAVMDELRAGVLADPVPCPSLVVIGEKDTDIPPAQSRKLAAYLKSDVLSYKGMSHVGPLMSTRAREVARDIIGWLKKKGL
jgi:pimeloyl-ACP methyl ester carboxylesterase